MELTKAFVFIQESDLIKMKYRAKQPIKTSDLSRSKLLFIMRIQGKSDMHPQTRKLLYALRLRRMFTGVFVKANNRILDILQKVEPYVTYGYPNLKSVNELIYKKGLAKINKQIYPLTDNNIIEQALGEHKIICVEDIVNEIANVGPHFKEVSNVLCPFTLNKPEKALQGLCPRSDFSTAMKLCPLMRGKRMEFVNPCPRQVRTRD
ncbi:putative ribosomal protein L7/L30 [Helianthus annuus]|nr:putative ribosomal protein L7/L30 [Helianthus annuus]